MIERRLDSPADFDPALTRLVEVLRFLPARRGDEPVPALFPLTVRWQVR
jgi:hypothetical protein